jgi:16S rRNA (guanine527-N7)-methyltransferase
VDFAEELDRVLPSTIPHRERLIQKASQHLLLIDQANEYMNLTRITTPREAAIKHVFDSVAPWTYFQHAKRVLDAGTGAGFPGIPLALVLPDVRFTLAESIQKKARFVDAAVESLELANVQVTPERAEEWALVQRPDIITARAVAPLHKLLELFAKSLKLGAQLILYKGPEVETELAEIKQPRIVSEVLERYDLPDGLGARTLVKISQR